MKKYYEFAGIELEISIPEQWMYQEEHNLAEFQTEGGENPEHFHFEMVEQLDEPFGELLAAYPDYCVYQKDEVQIRYVGTVNNQWECAYLRALHQGKNHQIQIKSSAHQGRIGKKVVLNAIEAEHLVVEAGGFILHASYVAWKGKAILFTAPSGTGKSTQAELWRKYRQGEIINGDRAVVRWIEDKVFAAGLPFSGSSSFCKNETLPLAAVVCLAQAPKTRIERMKGSKAFSKIFSECTVNTWNLTDYHRVINYVWNLLEQVPVYYLACTPDESAVNALEILLEGGKLDEKTE